MINSFALSFEAADILSEDLRVNLRQFPFEIPYAGSTREERGRTRRTVWADLEQRRLAEHGRQEAELEQALNLINRSQTAIAVTSVDMRTEAVYRARIAQTGSGAVFAEQRDNGLHFEFVDPRGLARIGAGLLPDEPAGRLEAATLPSNTTAPQPAQRDGADWMSSSAPAASRGAGAENRKAQRILALPVHRVGYVFVSGELGGKQQRLPAIGWRDTTEGRYSMTSRNNQDGQRWNTFAGADKSRVARYLGEQLAAFQNPR
ncbi:ESX secretion-associated protein EspG [Parasphingorhabdus pacifica]